MCFYCIFILFLFVFLIIFQSPLSAETLNNADGHSKNADGRYELPVSYEYFGYPIDPNDKKRCEGERKLNELYRLATLINNNNYVDLMTQFKLIKLDIPYEYNNYPDICAVAHLYNIEANFKHRKSLMKFSLIDSTSDEYFQYLQLTMQYSHLKDLNTAFTGLFNICKDRLDEIKANDKMQVELIKEMMIPVKNYEAELEQLISPNNIHDYEPDDKIIDSLAEQTAYLYNMICWQYSNIYNSYMKINDKTAADEIFKIEKKGSKYILSGKLYDAYNKTPYQYKFKYQQLDYFSDHDPVIKTGEINIKLYRDADNFLKIVKDMRNLQYLDKIDEIDSNGRSRNENRTINICSFIENFKPSDGSEADNIAREKISEEQLTCYKKFAYALESEKPILDYYKTKPKINEIYFTGNEDNEITKTDTISSTQFITLRAGVICGTHRFKSPDYAFLCRVFTIQSSDTRLPLSTTADNIKKACWQKFLALIPDNLNYKYYVKFQLNEITSDDKNIQQPTPESSDIIDRKINHENKIECKLLLKNGITLCAEVFLD